MSRHGTQLLQRARAAREAAAAPESPEPTERPDWRFCVRCNVLAPEKVAGDECPECGGGLVPTAGPRN